MEKAIYIYADVKPLPWRGLPGLGCVYTHPSSSPCRCGLPPATRGEAAVVAAAIGGAPVHARAPAKAVDGRAVGHAAARRAAVGQQTGPARQRAHSRKVRRKGAAAGGRQLRQRGRVGARGSRRSRCELLDRLLRLGCCGSSAALQRKQCILTQSADFRTPQCGVADRSAAVSSLARCGALVVVRSLAPSGPFSATPEVPNH